MLIVLLLTLLIIGSLFYLREKFVVYAPFLCLIEPILGLRSKGIGGPLITYAIIASSLVSSIWIIRSRRKWNYVNISMLYAFLAYHLLRIPIFSLDINIITSTLITFTAFLALHASIVYFDDINKLKILCRNALATLVILNMYFVISSYFSFGASPYGGVVYIYIGKYDVFALGGYALTVGMYPIITYLYNKRTIIAGVSSIISIIILVLLTKRNFVIIAVMPFIVYFGSSMFLLKSKSSLYRVGLFIVLIGIGWYYSSDFITARILSRGSAFQTDVIQQNRVQEFYLYPEIIRNEANPVRFMLFGRDYFKWGSTFNILSDAMSDTGRRWHSGAANYIFGFGLIGCILILGIWFRILMLYKVGLKNISFYGNRLLLVQGLMLILGVAFMSAMEGISSIQQGIVPFTYLGAVIGMIVTRNNSIMVDS